MDIYIVKLNVQNITNSTVLGAKTSICHVLSNFGEIRQ